MATERSVLLKRLNVAINKLSMAEFRAIVEMAEKAAIGGPHPERTK